MKRTITVFALGAMLFALCCSVEAQQPKKVHRIGFLDPSNASGTAVLVDAFRQELSKLGWIEGKNITIEYLLRSKSQSVYMSLRRIWFVLRLI
jgi:hypothetical protein